jgi:hypothetical protein
MVGLKKLGPNQNKEMARAQDATNKQGNKAYGRIAAPHNLLLPFFFGKKIQPFTICICCFVTREVGIVEETKESIIKQNQNRKRLLFLVHIHGKSQ